jgi:hypothetical protein
MALSSAGAHRHLGAPVAAIARSGSGKPSLTRLPPMRLDRVAPGWCPWRRERHVELVCPTLTLHPWVQQYQSLSQSGLVCPQCAGHGPSVLVAGGADVGGAQVVTAVVGGRAGRGVPCVTILDIDVCSDSSACISWAFVATSWSIVAFFCTEALARCSRDVAIWRPCASSSAAFAPKTDSAAVMRLMSRISANAAVQCVFQLGHVWSATGRRRHSLHASVILPVARACFVPVVTIVASEMGTPASVAKTWHFSWFLV